MLYKQQRPGYKGKPFFIYKFRTMTDKRDPVGNLLPDSERLTDFGRFLRSTSLDELTEIINILKGEMSWVGPRPFLPDELDYYKKELLLFQRVRPGITGLWQVSGRGDLSFDERVRYDEYYVRNWSIWLDLYILLRTVGAVLHGEGAY